MNETITEKKKNRKTTQNKAQEEQSSTYLLTTVTVTISERTVFEPTCSYIDFFILC